MGFEDHADRQAERKLQGFVTRRAGKEKGYLGWYQVSGIQSQYGEVGEKYSDERGEGDLVVR
jgi:hypothetical protein